MEERPQGFFGMIGSVGILVAVLAIGKGCMSNSNGISRLTDSAFGVVENIFQTILYLGITALIIYLAVLVGIQVVNWYSRMGDLEATNQRLISILEDKVHRFGLDVESFRRHTDGIIRRFDGIVQEFEDFKKTFHAEWHTAAVKILTESSKDPKIVDALKESLFPKIKASDSNLKSEVKDDDRKGSSNDRHL